jgi:hypothetical protein
MTGAELKSIRETYGLSASTMGLILGYSGPRSMWPFTSAGSSAMPGEYRPLSRTSPRCTPATGFLRSGSPDSPVGELDEPH